jgi:hypothetical protein
MWAARGHHDRACMGAHRAQRRHRSSGLDRVATALVTATNWASRPRPAPFGRLPARFRRSPGAVAWMNASAPCR